MTRLLAAAAVLALIVVLPTVALAVPGENGPPEWAGNDGADSAGAGPSATPPGNSGSNPHGGPPGQAPESPPAVTADSSGATTGTSGASSASQSTAASGDQGASPQGSPESNGNGPAEKITICHATHSETNPYVVITISSNGLHGHGRPGHQDDEDVIPAGSDGSCGTTRSPEPPEPPEQARNEPERAVIPTGGGGGSNPGGPSAQAPADDSTLPFTGLPLAFLTLAGVVAMVGGASMRRGAGSPNAGGIGEVSERCARVARDISDWEDSTAATAGRLEARLAALERSLPE
jgi:hypothetical protein